MYIMSYFMLSDAQILVSNNTILSFFAFIIFTHEYNETANNKNAASRQDQTFDFLCPCSLMYEQNTRDMVTLDRSSEFIVLEAL